MDTNKEKNVKWWLAWLCLGVCFSFIIIDLKLITSNLNEARDVKKRNHIFHLWQIKNVDIVFAQETHSDCLNEVDWEKEWDGTVVLSHKTNVSAGVAILFAKHFLPISYEVEEIVKGRLLKVSAKYDGVSFVLINVYAPVIASERMEFLETLTNVLQNCDPEHYLLLAGDFNCTAKDIDRNHLEPHTASRKALTRLIEMSDLVDVWRELNGLNRQYTWTHIKDNLLSMARLDQIYCFKHQLQVMKSCCINPVAFSDHAMVTVTVFINGLKSKSAYWIFNSVLLEDVHFKQCLEFFLEKIKINVLMYTTMVGIGEKANTAVV